MRSWRALIGIVVVACSVALSAQRAGDEPRELRDRLVQRFEVVPLSGGLALKPRARIRDVRLIEISDGAVVVNGVAVTGGELRERLGSDAEPVLRLSYLSADEQRALFAPAPPASPDAQGRAEPPLERTEPPRAGTPPAEPPGAELPRRPRRASGDRVRIFGNVTVERDEEVTGQVVAVLGSVRVDGEVGDQVVAVLGSVDLGPEAIVRGDVVSVGGRVHRAAGAQTRGGVTEVSLADSNMRIHMGPWGDAWGPFDWFVSFGAVPRLVGTGFRLLLLLLLTGIALLLARRSVEASAHRVNESPLKVTVIGLVAEVLALPALVLTAVVLSISIVGIPLLLLLPFVVLLLILMALVGFTGTAVAVGQWVQRRFTLGSAAPFASVCLGVIVILSPLLLGRLVALVGWPATPFAMALVGTGFAIELLAWASGFGAVLANTFTRWQAQRAARAHVAAPPAMP